MQEFRIRDSTSLPVQRYPLTSKTALELHGNTIGNTKMDGDDFRGCSHEQEVGGQSRIENS